MKGATAQDMNLVVKIGEEYKERFAKDSEIVKDILKKSGVKCPMPANVYCSPQDSSRGCTPSHPSMFNPQKDHLTQQILTTFSPDSAYSSNSSHSPPENASYGSQSRNVQQQPMVILIELILLVSKLLKMVLQSRQIITTISPQGHRSSNLTISICSLLFPPQQLLLVVMPMLTAIVIQPTWQNSAIMLTVVLGLPCLS